MIQITVTMGKNVISTVGAVSPRQEEKLMDSVFLACKKLTKEGYKKNVGSQVKNLVGETLWNVYGINLWDVEKADITNNLIIQLAGHASGYTSVHLTGGPKL